MFFLGFLYSSPKETAVSLPRPSIDRQSGLFEVISNSIISSLKPNTSTISSPSFSSYSFDSIIIPCSICSG